MALYGAFAAHKHFIEFASVLVSAEGNKTPLERRTEGVQNLTGNATIVPGDFDILPGTFIDEYLLTHFIADISAASSSWVVAPYAGSVVKIQTVIDTIITTGDAALTFEIGGVAMTNSAITIANSGSAAGTIDSSAPTALNVLTAGQAIEAITNGGSTEVSKAFITYTIRV